MSVHGRIKLYSCTRRPLTSHQGIQGQGAHPPLHPDPRSGTLNPYTILRLSTSSGHAPTTQRRRLWCWLLHSSLVTTTARPRSVHLHLYHPCLELHQPHPLSKQDCLASYLRPCSRQHRGRSRREQLSSIQPRLLDVHAQWRSRKLELWR